MASFTLTRLVNRKLIKISGPDCYPYLQSLFTNDLRYLYEPDRIPKREHAFVSPNVLSTYMLNAQGRVICDMLVYRTPLTKYSCEFTQPGLAKEHDELLIECDAKIASGLANTLYAYRVRRKVSLDIVDDLAVWCLYPELGGAEKQSPSENKTSNELQNFNLQLTAREILEDNLTVVCDPRLDRMGLRIITEASLDHSLVMKPLESKLNLADVKEASINRYILHKYRMGISEGLDDHPEGNCFPLECNADLLGSVSFDKGCYLGQELTARIHFTGVVRKRLMPVALTIIRSQPPELPFAPGSDVVDMKSGKKLGVLRNVHRGQGLSLIRHDQLTDSTELMHEATKTPLSTWRPHWWNLNA